MQKAWKDAAYGAALFITPGSDEIEKILGDAGVAESPLGRVPKQNPDRTISAEGRPINDMRCQNEAGSKFNHPPAPQPRHHAVARQSLWWKARHPGIPQRCAKRDVPRAFKWHFLKPGDVPEFAVKLAAGIITLSLTMPFGWVRSPGEFVAWSAAAKAHHGSFRPANPRFNDVVPFESKLWGLHMNFETHEVPLPEPKRIRPNTFWENKPCNEAARRSRSGCSKRLLVVLNTGRWRAPPSPLIFLRSIICSRATCRASQAASQEQGLCHAGSGIRRPAGERKALGGLLGCT